MHQSNKLKINLKVANKQKIIKLLRHKNWLTQMKKQIKSKKHIMKANRLLI